MSSPTDSGSDDDDGYYGPSLPPSSPDSSNRQEVIGPVLPSQWKNASVEQDEDDDAVAIGPLPPGDTANDPHQNHQPVLRKPQNDLPQREEWMTVIPAKVEKKLGFKSVTSFSKRPIGPPAGKEESATKGEGKELIGTAGEAEVRETANPRISQVRV